MSLIEAGSRQEVPEVVSQATAEVQKPEVPDLQFGSYEEKCEYVKTLGHLTGKAVIVTARITHRVVVKNEQELSVKIKDEQQFPLIECPAIVDSVTLNEVYIKVSDDEGHSIILGSRIKYFSAVLAEETESHETA